MPKSKLNDDVISLSDLCGDAKDFLVPYGDVDNNYMLNENYDVETDDEKKIKTWTISLDENKFIQIADVETLYLPNITDYTVELNIIPDYSVKDDGVQNYGSILVDNDPKNSTNATINFTRQFVNYGTIKGNINIINKSDGCSSCDTFINDKGTIILYNSKIMVNNGSTFFSSGSITLCKSFIQIEGYATFQTSSDITIYDGGTIDDKDNTAIYLYSDKPFDSDDVNTQSNFTFLGSTGDDNPPCLNIKKSESIERVYIRFYGNSVFQLGENYNLVCDKDSVSWKFDDDDKEKCYRLVDDVGKFIDCTTICSSNLISSSKPTNKNKEMKITWGFNNRYMTKYVKNIKIQ